jgi:DNA-binding SARP family transcriptional activator
VTTLPCKESAPVSADRGRLSRRSGTARSLADAATGVSDRLDATGSAVRLRLAGEFAVWHGGRFLTPADIGSRKARTLLAFLAVQRRGPATVDRIAEVLWDAAPPKRPAANVATLVSRLRAVLGSDVLVGGRAGYRLSDAVSVDLYDAAKLVNVAEARLAGSPSSALASALAAVELLGGEVLADEPLSEWADPIRVWSLQLMRRARHVTAEAGLRTGEVRTAKAAAEAALLADPLDEASYRHLMCVHQATDEPARALQVYEQLRNALASELGTLPALASRDLHAAILRAGNDRPDAHTTPVRTGDCARCRR